MEITTRLSKREEGENNNGYAFVEFSSPEECKRAATHCKREKFGESHLLTASIDSLMKSTEDSVGCADRAMIALGIDLSETNALLRAEGNPAQPHNAGKEEPYAGAICASAESKPAVCVTGGRVPAGNAS